jgi:MFS family permease
MPKEADNSATKSVLPRTVWLLGIVSLFMDMSSEMAHAILPLYLVGPLGASIAMVGLIDGAAEALAQAFKLFSGMLSDWVRSRKWLAVFGYGLSALTKPLFPLSVSPAGVLAARLADRIGKGIRGSPRDAMVADVTPPDQRGAAYGLRQSLDTVGAILGPLIAVGLLWWAVTDLRGILWVACVPALAAVAVLALGVREPERREKPKPWRNVLVSANPGRAFWLVLVFGVVFSLARMTEAFLVLKAQQENLPTAFIPLVMVWMSLFYFAAAYPAGKLADRIGARWLLSAGCAALALGDFLLAQSMGLAVMALGIAIWGLHMGLTQGALGKLVADAAPADLRATSFGYFYLACGVATLASGVAAGLLWDKSGPAASFLMGAGFALVALLAVPFLGVAKNTARKQSPS